MPSIYEDALADVKKLKEVAEQNVTNALIESIAPNVRRMIEQKLDIISTGGAIPEDDPEDMLLDVADDPAAMGIDVQGVGVTGKVVLDLGQLTGASAQAAPSAFDAMPPGVDMGADVGTDIDDTDLDVDLDDIEADGEDEEDDDAAFEVTSESLEPLINMMLESDEFIKHIDEALIESAMPVDRLIAEARYATTNAAMIARTAKRLFKQNKLNFVAHNAQVKETENQLFNVYKKLHAQKGNINRQMAESLTLELEIANARLNESPNENVAKVRRQVATIGKRVKNAILEMKNGVNANKYKKIEGAFSDFAKIQTNVRRLMVTESRDPQVDQIRQDLNKLLKECRLMARKNKLLNEEDVTLTLSLSGLPDGITDEDLEGLTVDVIGGDDEGEGDDEGAEGGDDMPDFGDFDVEDEPDEEDADVEETFVVEGDEEALTEMDDDTVVEIDENMLRRELRRMAEARNDAPPPNTAGGIDNAILSSFGGGDPDHAFLELGLDITGDGVGGNGFDPHGGGGTKVHENVNESRKNRAIRQILAKQQKAIAQLRGQLLEQNLLNLKLLYANRVLMNEGIARSTKASMIKSLNEAKNTREVKLLYKSLSGTVKKPGKTMNESRLRGGSSSRVTQSGGATRNEQAPALKRWQKLAGISE